MPGIRGVEKTLKALANARRLAILLRLRKSKKATVSDVAESIHLSFKATSKHLHILERANIVDYEQISINMYYRLVDPPHPLVKTALSIL